VAGGYSNGFVSVAAAAGAAYATLHTGASIRCRIQEIGLFVNAATASSVGLIRPSNTPVATTSVLGLAEDPADPVSTINVDTAWSTAPTIGTQFLRRITIPATIGNGIVWSWPPGAELIVTTSSWLVFWNFGAGAGSVLNGYVKWIE
jgi:hypothetical protein